MNYINFNYITHHALHVQEGIAGKGDVHSREEGVAAAVAARVEDFFSWCVPVPVHYRDETPGDGALTDGDGLGVEFVKFFPIIKINIYIHVIFERLPHKVFKFVELVVDSGHS